jgi:hypothetical protein
MNNKDNQYIIIIFKKYVDDLLKVSMKINNYI